MDIAQEVIWLVASIFLLQIVHIRFPDKAIITRRYGSVYLGVDVLRVCEVFYVYLFRDVSSAVALYILGVG